MHLFIKSPLYDFKILEQRLDSQSLQRIEDKIVDLNTVFPINIKDLCKVFSYKTKHNPVNDCRFFSELVHKLPVEKPLEEDESSTDALIPEIPKPSVLSKRESFN